ncbi:protein translocase subunit SecF [candidate division KSB1 bacterium]
MHIFKNPNYKFISNRKPAFILSITLIVVGLVFLIIRGPNYGIDFKGGTQIEFKFQKEANVSELRTSLARIGYERSQIRNFGDNREILIYVDVQEEHEEVSNAIKDAISTDFSDNPYEVQRIESVGPKIGAELIRKALWAILVSLIFVNLYISWRFQFRFAVGAITALIHDVLIVLGIFTIFNMEISIDVVAGFLTIVGYSINDTIVVYDRIRENLKAIKRETYENIVNRSINETLSRTVITSGTTFIVLLILFLFGGAVIRNFAFALLIGVIVGTYSSIFIASPVVVEWNIRSEKKMQLKKLKR